MGSKWELAEDIADAISFVIEFIIFTLFIYEESLQIQNRLLMDRIAFNDKNTLYIYMHTDFDFVMSYARNFFEGFGILSIYACNAYSSYLFSSMMTREWAQLFGGGPRMSYSFSRTGIF